MEVPTAEDQSSGLARETDVRGGDEGDNDEAIRGEKRGGRRSEKP